MEAYENKCMLLFFLSYLMWNYELTTMLIVDVSLALITTQSILFLDTSSLTQKQEESKAKKNFRREGEINWQRS